LVLEDREPIGARVSLVFALGDKGGAEPLDQQREMSAVSHGA
jgi:hypothetical protein